MIKKWSCKLVWFNLKNEKYHSKNYKKWSCKLISLNLKNKQCYLKNNIKWSRNADFIYNTYLYLFK